MGEARIILLMETADTVSLDDAHALGAHDRLYKPLPVSILEKRVRDLLANSSIHAVTASQPTTPESPLVSGSPGPPL